MSAVGSDSDDDDHVWSADELLSQLSPEARAALSAVQSKSALSDDTNVDAIVDEKFGLSQFWYDDDFSRVMALELLTHGGAYPLAHSHPLTIACIACPSVYHSIRPLLPEYPGVRCFLLEYDQRFARYGADFVLYDVHNPIDLPSELYRAADIVCADPPYLNATTMAQLNKTIRFILKSKRTQQRIHTDTTEKSSSADNDIEIGSSTTDPRIIVNSGAVLADTVYELLQCRSVVLRPRHRVHIMNEFRSYVDYDSVRLGHWERDELGYLLPVNGSSFDLEKKASA